MSHDLFKEPGPESSEEPFNQWLELCSLITFVKTGPGHTYMELNGLFRVSGLPETLIGRQFRLIEIETSTGRPRYSITNGTIEAMGHKVNLPSGKFVVRVQPTLHAELKQIAELEDSTLNAIVQGILHRGVAEWLLRRKEHAQAS